MWLMYTCQYCGLLHSDAASICRKCWDRSAHVAHAFSAVLSTLSFATDTEWVAEHTGGGCYWLATYDPRLPDDAGPVMCLTEADDVLSSSSAPSEIGTWGLGIYPEGSLVRQESERWYECSDEELPLIARDEAARLGIGPSK